MRLKHFIIAIISIFILNWLYELYYFDNNVFIHIRNSSNFQTDEMKLFIDSIFICAEEITISNKWRLGKTIPIHLDIGNHNFKIKSKDKTLNLNVDLNVFYSHVIYIILFEDTNNSQHYTIEKHYGREILPP